MATKKLQILGGNEEFNNLIRELTKGIIPKGTTTYDPNSDNAISGKAVNEAISSAVSNTKQEVYNKVYTKTEVDNKFNDYYTKENLYSKTEMNAKLPRYKSVTLLSSGWNSSSQTVEVFGVVADKTKQLIIPAPTFASIGNAYNEAGIRCVDQAENKLTFAYQLSKPEVDIEVSIAIIPLEGSV